MADDETALSSPGSTGAANGTKASKDRACPFCGQAFTSSSLGRHLDLYIKPKNPKPADGVHDVDEIRKIRGGITRRQPRTSTKGANAGAGPGSNDGPNAANRDDSRRSESVATSQIASNSKPYRMSDYTSENSPTARPTPGKETDLPRTVFNSANWLATGVINDLPPRSTSQAHTDIHISNQAQRMQEMRRHVDGSKLPRPEYESESMSKLQEAAELGRAAEMALREVLGSLEAAQKRTEPTNLFEDFDFFSLSFPGLCLAVLPAPRTLFCVAPFPSADSWSIGPPGLRQFEALSKCLRVKAVASPRTDIVTDDMIVKHQSHLTATWEHWQTMSESEQTSTWNLEILRSLHHAQERSHNLSTALETAQQRALHLEAEYDRLSRCQLPRDYLNHPPNTVPIPTAVMRSVNAMSTKTTAAKMDYDAEALIAKWRASIKINTRPYRASAGLQQAQTVSTPRAMQQPPVTHDMVMNGSVFGLNGPMHREEALTHQNLEGAGVSYETPPEPGVVIGVEDADATGDMEDDNGDPYAADTHNTNIAIVNETNGDVKSHRGLDRSARAQRTAPSRRIVDASGNAADPASTSGATSVNVNGKRSLNSTTTTGRGNKAQKVSNADATG